MQSSNSDTFFNECVEFRCHKTIVEPKQLTIWMHWYRGPSFTHDPEFDNRRELSQGFCNQMQALADLIIISLFMITK